MADQSSAAVLTRRMPIAAADARLQHPRPGHLLRELRDARVVQHVHEVWHEDVGVLRLHAHGQLVAEVARGRLAHPRDAQVLAQ